MCRRRPVRGIRAAGAPASTCPQASDESHAAMDTGPDSAGWAVLFRRLAALDRDAFAEIATRLRATLLSHARRRLERQPELRGIYDEEDAYQSAISIIWLRFLTGAANPPGGLDDFLRLARTIIARRITAKARAERGPKRNPTPNEEAAWSKGPLSQLVPDETDVFVSSLPRPEAVTIAEDETRWLMAILGWRLAEVAEERFMRGLTLEEIAAKKGLSPRTVSRMFQDIQEIWQDAVRKHRE
jgi:DNA-directed RNA polymerase specialized sigma24 family protein